MGKREKNLLDILTKEGIHTVLQETLDENELYQSAKKKADETLNELQKAGLNREQNKVVDKVPSATNASGAAYGATAYKQGLYDGIRLMPEVNRISREGGMLNEQKLGCEKEK